jgi:hypothetical protein
VVLTKWEMTSGLKFAPARFALVRLACPTIKYPL